MDAVTHETTKADAGHGIRFSEAFWVWLRVALLSFGGPAGQIAVMHRILVEEKNWISESRFLHALNYCMLLPGPEAQQLATYIGWLMHRTWGGIVAGALLCFIPIMREFVIPDLLGSSSTSMIGQILWLEFFGNRDWPVASALAVVLLALLVTPTLVYRQRETRQLERGRA